MAADDFGKLAKGRYRLNGREGPSSPEDPLAVFRAAIRGEALEEAAKISEALSGFGATGESGVWQRNPVAAAIRSLKET